MNVAAWRKPYSAILTIAFLSGASCLIYEVVWSRYLHLIFGVSNHAVATVLACFMIGMALGAWFFGRAIDRTDKPFRYLYRMQLAICAYIFLSPALYPVLTAISTFVIRDLGSDSPLRHFMRFFLAMLVLLVPTMLMGGTIPAFIKLASKQQADIGRDVGMIYAVNTIGGAVGAFFAGFILIRVMGLRNVLLLAGTLNLIAAAMLLTTISNPPPLAVPVEKKPKKSARKPRAPAVSNAMLLTVIGISGFTGLAYEVFWTRVLSLFFKDSIYDLTIVLTAFLCGLAGGSLLCSWWMRRWRIRRQTLAIVQIIIGLSAIIGLFLISRFPYWINYLQTNTALVTRFGDDYWFAGNSIRFGYAFMLMLVPTTLFGAVFPMVTSLYTNSIHDRASHLGFISGINTLGAAVGAIMAGFVLVWLVGLNYGIALTAMLNIVIGMVLLNSWVTRVAWSVVVLMIVAAMPKWDRLRMSTSFLDSNQPLENLLDLKFYREDTQGITSVVELTPLRKTYLVTNRLFGQNSSDMLGLQDHRRLGHIPMLLHPRPLTALHVGLGAGITLRGISDFEPKTLDCVELSPGVIEAAGYFSDVNDNVLKKPNVRVIAGDARNFMTMTRSSYDVIVLDILQPMSSGSSAVFSREYFQMVRKRMEPGGLVCQWLPVHQLTMDQIKTITATFQSVFPYTTLWFGTIGESVPVVGCIGTERRLSIDFNKLAERTRAPAIISDLREVVLHKPELLLSHFIMADDAVARFSKNHRLDTDDRPVIEFAAPRIATQAQELGISNLQEFSRLVRDARPYVINSPDMQDLEPYLSAKKAVIDGFDFVLRGDPQGRFRFYQSALMKDPANEDLIYMVRQMSSAP